MGLKYLGSKFWIFLLLASFAALQVSAQVNSRQDTNEPGWDYIARRARLLTRDIDQASRQINELEERINDLEERIPNPYINSRMSPLRISANLLPMHPLTREVYADYDRLSEQLIEAQSELEYWVDSWHHKVEELEVLAESYNIGTLEFLCTDLDILLADDGQSDIRCLISFYLDNYSESDPGKPHQELTHLRLSLLERGGHYNWINKQNLLFGVE